MIKIKGGTAKQKAHVGSLVEFCRGKLMPRMHGLEITVRLTKCEDHGYCMAESEDRADRPRTFEIEINKDLKLRDLLQTVAHEMVHVKQYARGELYESTRKGKWRWQGKWMSNNVDYYDEPWEIEAHGREYGLFRRWAEATGHSNKKWAQG